MPALLTHFGHGVQPSRRQAQGPALQPHGMLLPQRSDAQVVKTYRRRRLVRVRLRVICGMLAGVAQVLAPRGWQINTAFIERLNVTIRHHVSAMGRRLITLCKSEDGLCQPLALYHIYDNFCVPHTRLRLPRPQPLPTNGMGSAKTRRPRLERL